MGDRLPRLHPTMSGLSGFLMRKVSQASSERFAQIAAGHGLHPMHFPLLMVLDAEGPVSQQELGRMLGVDPSTMVARMDVLEEAGLVERRRSAEDRRAYEIVLTAAGRRVLKALSADAQKHAERFFRALSPKEREQLNALLLKLAATVDEDAAPGA
jgi:MarR family transcriptional regulator, lower aerobic nicotinate degradation pathway regulator